jgi:8-oxo-dGTP diphosphatase
MDPTPDAAFIEVAAGVIFKKGSLLITQRKPTQHLGGLWEFPGGKREKGESFEECLHRELFEELRIRVSIDRLIQEITHQYLSKKVVLRFYLCRWTEGEPLALGCQHWRWIRQDELFNWSFPPADDPIVNLLACDSTFWSTI